MSSAATGIRDVPKVLVTAVRLLAKHWPALLALAMLSAGLRAGFLWAAIELSDVAGWLGRIVLILAPISYLIPVIIMLRICRDSLPNLSALEASEGPTAPTEQREQRLVDIAVSMLVPFLAVYVSYGLLRDDIARYENQVAADEFFSIDFTGTAEAQDFGGRLAVYTPAVVLGIVIVAWLLRWGLGRMERKSGFLALAFIGALIEVFYTGNVAEQIEEMRQGATDWVTERRAADWVVDRYDTAVGALGPMSNPIDYATTWLFGLLGAIDAVVIVPIAWLTVAAVVLGHKLTPPPATEKKRPVIDRMPVRVRSGVTSLFSDIASRWSAFFSGLRLLGTAGLVPMLTFGVAFLIAIRIPYVVSLLWREIAGPTDTGTWLAFSPIESSTGLALSTLVTVPLLAAAVEWLVAARQIETAEPDQSEGAASST